MPNLTYLTVKRQTCVYLTFKCQTYTYSTSECLSLNYLTNNLLKRAIFSVCYKNIICLKENTKTLSFTASTIVIAGFK